MVEVVKCREMESRDELVVKNDEAAASKVNNRPFHPLFPLIM